MSKVTEVVFVIDASGSMFELTSDTIGGFNSFIKDQKDMQNDSDTVLVSAVKFSNYSSVLYDRVPIDEVKKMTEKQYTTDGCTALLDAIGDAVHHIGTVHKYARKEDIPESTMFVIITDGYENASHKYSSDEVKKMIKAKEKLGWQFLFLGANIDAVETGANFGITEENCVNYHADSAGTAVVYKAVSKATCKMRKCGSVSADWACEVNEDFENRK